MNDTLACARLSVSADKPKKESESEIVNEMSEKRL